MLLLTSSCREYVVDANIILSGLISDSMTRRLLVELEDDLLATFVGSGSTPRWSPRSPAIPVEVDDLIEILFKRIDIVPRSRSSTRSKTARIMRDATPTTQSTWRPPSSATRSSGCDDGDHDE